MSYYKNQLNEYLAKSEVKTGKVLDIGGSAGSVKDKVKSFKVDEYLILDNNAEAKYCKDWKQPDLFWDMNKDIEESLELKDYHNYFDQIFMLEVAEYLYDPMTAFKNITKLLKPGGVLICSGPFIYPYHSPGDIDYMRYTLKGIQKLIEEAGLTLCALHKRVAKYPDVLSDFYMLEKMHPLKGSPDHEVIGFIVEAVK